MQKQSDAELFLNSLNSDNFLQYHLDPQQFLGQAHV